MGTRAGLRRRQVPLHNHERRRRGFRRGPLPAERTGRDKVVITVLAGSIVETMDGGKS